jgi:hypothetical protein
MASLIGAYLIERRAPEETRASHSGPEETSNP